MEKLAAKNPILLTREGLKKLKEEYEYLTTVKRKEVVAQLKEACVANGSSEDAECAAAREEQRLVEKRVADLTSVLKSAEVVERVNKTDLVAIGSIVTVEVEGQVDEFQIVGTVEADPARGRISNESPLGKALLGAKVGDIVEVSASAVKSVYKVLEIK